MSGLTVSITGCISLKINDIHLTQTDVNIYYLYELYNLSMLSHVYTGDVNLQSESQQ